MTRDEYARPPNCPNCGLPADTPTGVHYMPTDCIQAVRADNAVLRAEIERMRQYLELLNELTGELAELEKDGKL